VKWTFKKHEVQTYNNNKHKTIFYIIGWNTSAFQCLRNYRNYL